MGLWVGLVGVAACADVTAPVGAGGNSGTEPRVLPESSAAQARVAELRQRFLTPEGSPVLGLGLVEALAPTDNGRLRPIVDAAARRAPVKPARVELPAHAADPVFLQDEQSHMAITFALEGARAVEVAMAGGLAVYRAALQGADIVQRASSEGSEDFIAFERRPVREELRYRVDVAGVAGLRLVANVLEFLDDEGTPRLRVAAPYVVDGAQAWHEAELAVEDCAVDTSPSEPWGREVTRPGPQSCTVVVTWPAVSYPALVDPTWATTGSMATARAYHTASALWDGRLLVAGGNATTTLASAEIFDPATGTFGTTGSMTTARTGHAAAVLAGGDVFVAGGNGTSGYLASTEIFDPTTGAWTAGPSMAKPRVGHTATVILSGEILLVGGKSSSSTYLATAETYDPVANAWVTNPQPTPSMVTARSGHAAVLLWNGKVLVTGGTAAAAVASAEIYSPGAWGRTGSWASGGSMTTARYGHTASFLSTGFVLVAGGQTSATNWTATAELYDVTLATWSSTASLTAARAGHTASVLSIGNVIVAGGVNNGTSPLGTEVFDETLHTWSAGGDLVAARYGHAAAVLGSSGVDDGPAVVTGGYNGTNYLASAEVYGSNANGATCAQGTDCLSRYCVDGVCCNSACSGFCEACSFAKNGVGPDGTCTPINAGLDPENECSEDAPTTCGQTGFCDGNGACQSYPKGTACGVICNGDLKQNMACDGRGACWASSSIDCTPFTCGGGACKSACADYPDCASGYGCTASGTCVAPGDLGWPCTRPAECYSNYCIDGACCDTSCGGFCQACTVAKKSSGSDGTCGMIAAGHDPDGECASQRSCQGNTLLATSCNGSGTCSASTIDCSPYICSADACPTSCASGADCVAGFSCHGGVCETGSNPGPEPGMEPGPELGPEPTPEPPGDAGVDAPADSGQDCLGTTTTGIGTNTGTLTVSTTVTATSTTTGTTNTTTATVTHTASATTGTITTTDTSVAPEPQPDAAPPIAVADAATPDVIPDLAIQADAIASRDGGVIEAMPRAVDTALITPTSDASASVASDGGVVLADVAASVARDATAAQRDGGQTGALDGPGTDGAATTTKASGGCGCAVGRGNTDPAGFWPLLIVGLLVLWRRETRMLRSRQCSLPRTRYSDLANRASMWWRRGGNRFSSSAYWGVKNSASTTSRLSTWNTGRSFTSRSKMETTSVLPSQV